jgi:hypothetical protein
MLVKGGGGRKGQGGQHGSRAIRRRDRGVCRPLGPALSPLYLLRNRFAVRLPQEPDMTIFRVLAPSLSFSWPAEDARP